MEPPAPPDGTKDGNDGKGGAGEYLSPLISVLLSPLTGRRRPKQVCVLYGGGSFSKPKSRKEICGIRNRLFARSSGRYCY